jgi:hypothetical protein
MPSHDVDHDIVIICMLCCLVASALSAAFAYTIAKTQRSKPLVPSEPQPDVSDTLEAQPAAVTEVRFRANASFM